MTLSQSPLNLRLAQPFTIARGTQTEAHNVLVRLDVDGVEGLGEAAPSEHYGDTQETSSHFIDLAREIVSGKEPIHALHQALDAIARSILPPKPPSIWPRMTCWESA